MELAIRQALMKLPQCPECKELWRNGHQPACQVGLALSKLYALDGSEGLRPPMDVPKFLLPPLGGGPRRKILIEIEVPEDWEKRLDMQSVLEREIFADRWLWRWPR